ncbi:hypothetical protein CEXT_314571, partial [Caerostris extrusa]
MQLLSEIRIHLWALLQWLFTNMTRLCTYGITIRDLNPLMGSTAAVVFRRDQIMQLLPEIRIYLWALLQWLFSNMTRLCTY